MLVACLSGLLGGLPLLELVRDRGEKKLAVVLAKELPKNVTSGSSKSFSGQGRAVPLSVSNSACFNGG